MKTPRYRFLLRMLALAVTVVLASMTALARPLPAPLSGSARPVIERFLMNQTAGLPGKVSIRIDTPLSGELPPCEVLEPFLPGSTRLWGRVSVGVRCTAGQPWTRYVPAYIAVVGHYYVAARRIDFGEVLKPADVAVREGDLTTLPGSVIVDPAQFNGMTASNLIAAGAPIRSELLRGVVVVQQGQYVKVVTRGAGFVASTEGKAMTDATAGAIIQVKMQGGRMISGVVGPEGLVERSN